MNNPKTHSGYVALLGRPNVGKSTLLNKILGKKISITSRKPQTTRHKILGVKTIDEFQTIYVDTPGIHSDNESQLNLYMNKAALSVVHDVDLIIFMVGGTIWREEDEAIIKILQKAKCPVILAINKTDLVLQKEELLEFIDRISQKREFTTIIPLSAKNGSNVASLEETVKKFLPEGPFYFPPEQSTDRNDNFLISEIIREKLMLFIGQELPYSICVGIDQMVMKKGVRHIMATIYVERDGQKAIIVGKNGEVLKKVGTQARHEMEDMFGHKVFLQLWVKVKKGWTDNEAMLQRFGFRS